ncbi:MAG: hypothetical protein IIZ93_14190 [Acidaminococcaceae bacterium]|nr:hypothetical protein [Acidaminococcaceae bacterium]
MNCPLCGERAIVLDSRYDDLTIRRRRMCQKCEHRFTTYEINADSFQALFGKLYGRKLIMDIGIATGNAVRELLKEMDFDNETIAKAIREVKRNEQTVYHRESDE